MDVFQYSPLEALAFNFDYVSFGFLATNTIQSLFTCVAILTTAVSFWRFTTIVGSNSFRRTKSSSSPSSSGNFDGSHSTPSPPIATVQMSPHPLPLLGSTSPDHLQLDSEKKPFDDHEASTCNCVRRRSSSSSSLVGPIPIEDEDENYKVNLKAKFTLYYSELYGKEEEEEEDQIEGVDVLRCSSGAPQEFVYSSGRWCSDGISARRSGGDLLSWYRYQDLTVLNGSVVKLWDCRKRKNTSSSACFPPPALEVIG